MRVESIEEILEDAQTHGSLIGGVAATVYGILFVILYFFLPTPRFMGASVVAAVWLGTFVVCMWYAFIVERRWQAKSSNLATRMLYGTANGFLLISTIFAVLILVAFVGLQEFL